MSKCEASNLLARLAARSDQQRRMLLKAARYGKICGGCGRKLRDREPVWRERRTTGRTCLGGIGKVLALLCAECRSEDSSGWLFGACETCGRLVHYADGSGMRRRWAFCCYDCQRKQQSTYQAAIARQRRAEARGPSRPCAGCGEHFEPTRADAKFCSGACKQKAHRKARALRLANGGHCFAFESRNAAERVP